jgi:hypothetical protein
MLYVCASVRLCVWLAWGSNEWKQVSRTCPLPHPIVLATPSRAARPAAWRASHPPVTAVQGPRPGGRGMAGDGGPPAPLRTPPGPPRRLSPLAPVPAALARLATLRRLAVPVAVRRVAGSGQVASGGDVCVVSGTGDKGTSRMTLSGGKPLGPDGAHRLADLLQMAPPALLASLDIRCLPPGYPFSAYRAMRAYGWARGRACVCLAGSNQARMKALSGGGEGEARGRRGSVCMYGRPAHMWLREGGRKKLGRASLSRPAPLFLCQVVGGGRRALEDTGNRSA